MLRHISGFLLPRKDWMGETEMNAVSYSGNVFADLGLPGAEELVTKAEIVSRISDIIAKRKLTQAATAGILGIDQPKVSALVRGRLDGFSIERLFRFLNALDRDVEITIKPKKKGAVIGRTRVIAP